MPEDAFWLFFLFGLPVLAGRALRSRVLLQAELREKARPGRARPAGARARGRGGRARADRRPSSRRSWRTGSARWSCRPRPCRARSRAETARGAAVALAAIEETGRDALTEMRRLLGVLRRDGDGPELAPQPGLPRVLALVERTRDGGLPVELRIEGREEAWAARGGRRLPPGIDLTGYRVIEDALEAAAEQGATAAELVIRYTPEELRLQVTDDREGGASDRLPGLRDRVGLYGGHLSAGPPRRGRLPPQGAAADRGGELMRRRLRGLSERDWRVIDRLFVVFLAVVHGDRPRDQPGPRGAARAERRSDDRHRPVVRRGAAPGRSSTVACTLSGLTRHGHLADAAAGHVRRGADAGEREPTRSGVTSTGRIERLRARRRDRRDGGAGDHLRPERHLLPGHVLLDRPLAGRAHDPQPDDARARAGREGRARRSTRARRTSGAPSRSSAAASRASCTTCSPTTSA